MLLSPRTGEKITDFGAFLLKSAYIWLCLPQKTDANVPEKLTDLHRYLICKRYHDARATSKVWPVPGLTRQLMKEFGVSERTAQRIGKMNLEDLREKASVVEGEDGKIRIRVPVLTSAPSEVQAPAPQKREFKEMSEPFSIMPIGSRLKPVHLTRRYGKLEHVSAEGSIIIMDSKGTAVRVLACPMYDRRHAMLRRVDVDITSIEGLKIRGEVAASAKVTGIDGKTIEGSLVFYGIRGNEITQVSRVEFHPDVFPAQYVEDHIRIKAEMRKRIGARLAR